MWIYELNKSFFFKMKKKAQSLSMNTIIILIIVIVALIALVLLWSKFGGQLMDVIQQQTNSSIELLPKK